MIWEPGLGILAKKRSHTGRRFGLAGNPIQPHGQIGRKLKPVVEGQ